VRDQVAHERTRRRDHPDRHQRAAPRGIWFMHRDMADAGFVERAREGG